jgi:hypothetical protein
MIEKTMTIMRKVMVALSIAFAVTWVVQQADTQIASLSVRGSGLRGSFSEANVNGPSTKKELHVVVQEGRHLAKLVGLGGGGEPAASVFPLQLCQGDCDNDDEVSSFPVCQQAASNIA